MVLKLYINNLIKVGCFNEWFIKRIEEKWICRNCNVIKRCVGFRFW